MIFQSDSGRSCLKAKRSLVIFSSNTFVFASRSKFKVLNYPKLVVTLAFTEDLLALLLAKG